MKQLIFFSSYMEICSVLNPTLTCKPWYLHGILHGDDLQLQLEGHDSIVFFDHYFKIPLAMHIR